MNTSANSAPQADPASPRPALLLAADGTSRTVQPAGTEWTLEELQALVGGWIQIISLADGRELVIHEEGKLLGLPVNAAATKLFLVNRAWYDEIWGDALLCEKGQVT